VRKCYIAYFKIFEAHRLNSRRCPVFPGVISNSRRFSGVTYLPCELHFSSKHVYSNGRVHSARTDLALVDLVSLQPIKSWRCCLWPIGRLAAGQFSSVLWTCLGIQNAKKLVEKHQSVRQRIHRRSCDSVKTTLRQYLKTFLRPVHKTSQVRLWKIN